MSRVVRLLTRPFSVLGRRVLAGAVVCVWYPSRSWPFGPDASRDADTEAVGSKPEFTRADD